MGFVFPRRVPDSWGERSDRIVSAGDRSNCRVAIAVLGHGLFVSGPVDGVGDLADEAETLD